MDTLLALILFILISIIFWELYVVLVLLHMIFRFVFSKLSNRFKPKEDK